MCRLAILLVVLAVSIMHISGQSLIPDFSPGWCSFDAVVYQYCEDSGVMTFLDVSPLYDGAGKQFMEQTDSINLTRGKKLRSMVVEKELRIRFEHDSVQCECMKSGLERAAMLMRCSQLWQQDTLAQPQQEEQIHLHRQAMAGQAAGLRLQEPA